MSQRLKFWSGTILLLALMAAAAYFTSRPHDSVRRKPGTNRKVNQEPSHPETLSKASTRRTPSEIGFASRQKQVEHYRKHGREFGSITMAEYLRQAQDLRDREAGGDILENIRADGVVTRFDRTSGAFIAFNPDRTIRTYFRPNDGEAYFQRQKQRSDR